MVESFLSHLILTCWKNEKSFSFGQKKSDKIEEQATITHAMSFVVFAQVCQILLEIIRISLLEFSTSFHIA